MLLIFHSDTIFQMWPISYSVKKLSKCDSFFSVTQLSMQTWPIFQCDTISRFSQCEPFYQIWPIFLQCDFFPNVTHFFTVRPILYSVTHVLQCNPFLFSVTHFSLGSILHSLTYFIQSDPFLHMWPILCSVTYFSKCEPFSQFFYSATNILQCNSFLHVTHFPWCDPFYTV